VFVTRIEQGQANLDQAVSSLVDGEVTAPSLLPG
jgi:exonuclease VII small subunit